MTKGRPKKTPAGDKVFWMRLDPATLRALDAYAKQLEDSQPLRIIRYTRQDAARGVFAMWMEKYGRDLIPRRMP